MHISVKYHFIQENIEIEDMKMIKFRSEDNIADLITKALPKTTVVKYLKEINIDIGLKRIPNIGE